VQNVAYTCTVILTAAVFINRYRLFTEIVCCQSLVTWVCGYFVIVTNCLKVLCKPNKCLNTSLKTLGKGSLKSSVKFCNVLLV